MAIAKQCDICGKVYKQYNNMDNPKKPNGLMLVNLDSESRTYATHIPMDLCPDCIKKLLEFTNRKLDGERYIQR